MSEVVCVWQEPALLGEGPLWVARENALYWLDIFGHKIHRYDLEGETRRTWTLPNDTLVTSLAVRQGGGFVGTTREGFAFLAEGTMAMTPILRPVGEVPGNRFNDGKVDGNGRYWAGTMDNDETLPTGSLYRLDGDLSCHSMDSGYIVSNGPTFSANGRILYHTHSAKRTIYAFDCAPDGSLSGKRVFVQLTDEAEGFPDGMTVDSEDCVWLCHFAGSRLTRFSPQGQALQVVPLPVPNVTSCTFAGPNLDTLYITTARHHLSEAALSQAPLAGSLFAYRPGVAGLPTHAFRESKNTANS